MALNKRKIRIPFQPLNYSAKHLAQPQELMINYTNGAAFVLGLDNTTEIEFLTGQSVSDYAQLEINKILDGVSDEYNTLEKIDIVLKELEDWKATLFDENDTVLVDSLTEVLQKFQGMSEGDQSIIEAINSKVDVVPGKVLSDKNFTNELKAKLAGIADNANKYEHPDTKECNYEPELLSVNGKVGDVNLTHKDIAGLEDIDPDANNYSHPANKVCNYVPKVTKINNKTGDVILTKDDIGLNNMQNYKLATGNRKNDNFTVFENNKYVEANMTRVMLVDRLIDYYPTSEFLNIDNSITSSSKMPLPDFGMTVSAFLTAIGLSNKLFRGTSPMFQPFTYNGKQMYILNTPIIDISWNELNAAGLIVGKQITVNGVNYRCRSPKATEGVTLTLQPYYSGNHYYPQGEAERIFFASSLVSTEEFSQYKPIIATESMSSTECAVIDPYIRTQDQNLYYTKFPEGITKGLKTAKMSWYPIIEEI